MILRKALAIDPVCQRTESKNLHNYLALIFQERGDIGEAIAEYRESIRLFHNDIWARQQLGVIFEDEGRHFEAQIQYSKILEIDSENLLAKDRLQVLNQLSTLNIVKINPVDIIEIDNEQIIRDGYLAETTYPNADAVILLNQFSHEILTNGQNRYTTHQIIKLLTYRGIKQYDDIAIPYNPDAQYLTVNQARTILSDGSIYQSEAFNRVTPPGLLEYNLNRVAQLNTKFQLKMPPRQVVRTDSGEGSISSQPIQPCRQTMRFGCRKIEVSDGRL